MNEFAPMVNQAAQQFGVPAELLMAQLQTESNFNPKAVGPATKYGTAQGIAQMLPQTAKSLGVDPMKPDQAINGMARLMAENMKRYGNEADAVQAYHGGTNKDNWGPKTQAYRDEVMKIYKADKFVNSDPDMQLMVNFKPQPSLGADIPAALVGDADYDLMVNFKPSKSVSPAISSKESVAGVSPEKELPKGTPQEFASAAGHHMMNPIYGMAQLGMHGMQYGAEKLGMEGAANNLQTRNAYGDAYIANREKEYQANTPDSYASYAGATAGEVLSPANLLAAARAGNALVRGAVTGSKVGAMQTVTDTEDGYAGNKAAQVAVGSVVGPVAEVAGSAAVNAVKSGANKLTAALTPNSIIEKRANNLIDTWAVKNKLTPEEISTADLSRFRDAVASDIRAGGKGNVDEITRRMDIKLATGDEGTAGQITRDPTKFTNEKELSKTEAGAPLARKYASQDAAMKGKINEIGAGDAKEAVPAGRDIMQRLKKIDEPLEADVNSRYAAAREAEGKDISIDTTNLKKSYSEIADEYDDVIPSAIRKKMATLESEPLTIENAEKLLKTINRHYKPEDTVQTKALGELKTAINKSLDDAAESGAGMESEQAISLFREARSAARDRLQRIENTPALRAALRDESPDKFVSEHIIKGESGELKSLAEFAKGNPEVKTAIKQQIAEHLRRVGFGEDAASGSPLRQEMYNKAIRTIGTDRLKLFFSPDEVSTLQSIGRAGALIHSQPSGSSVNNSNTASKLLKGLSKVGSLPILNMARDTIDTFAKEMAVSKALSGKVSNPSKAANKLSGSATAAISSLAANKLTGK